MYPLAFTHSWLVHLLVGIPPWQVHPPGSYPSLAGTPLAGTPQPPGRYTPTGRYTPHKSSACWEIWATSGQYASYWNAFLLPPATKLGQGYVFTGICHSLNRGGQYLTRYPPQTRYTPQDQVHLPGPGTPLPPDQVHLPQDQVPPGTRYTPPDQVQPPGTRYPPRPGTPPGTRYTPQTRYTHPGPGTPPWTRYTPPGTRYTPPLGPGTPPFPLDQVHPPDKVHLLDQVWPTPLDLMLRA